MSAQYPYNTPLTPQEWYCRPDGTICIKNWAGLLVIEHVPAVHARIVWLFEKLSALYNQQMIPFMLNDYDANGNAITQIIGVFVRYIAQNGVALFNWGLPPSPPGSAAVRQYVFHTLPYRRDLKEIIDTV